MAEPLDEARVAKLTRWFEKGIPFNAYLGLRLEVLERGRAVIRIPWTPNLIGDPTRPAVHGGVLSMLVDTTGGAACFAMLDSDDDRLSTVDLRVDYLRPGPAEDLVCEANIVRMGNRMGVTRMHIHARELPKPGEDASPIATGTAVYSVVRRS